MYTVVNPLLSSDYHCVQQQSYYALAYAVFITSAFCYFLITWSNKYLPSSIMTAFWPMQVSSINVVSRV